MRDTDLQVMSFAEACEVDKCVQSKEGNVFPSTQSHRRRSSSAQTRPHGTRSCRSDPLPHLEPLLEISPVKNTPSKTEHDDCRGFSNRESSHRSAQCEMKCNTS